jgi:hypothetical protein
MYTSHFFPGHDIRVMIALGVGFFRLPEHILRAVLDADFTSLAALWNDVHLTTRHLELINVKRCTGENFHNFPALPEK